MITLRQVIVYIVRRRPGITDRQLTEAIYGSDERHQQVNTECRNCPDIERRQGETHIENFIKTSRRAAPTIALVQQA
jgi:hypothetical protein